MRGRDGNLISVRGGGSPSLVAIGPDGYRAVGAELERIPPWFGDDDGRVITLEDLS